MSDPVASGEPSAIGRRLPDARGEVQVVRGAPADDEVAALLAVLCARRAASARPVTGYDAWRAGRLAALRRQAPGR